MVASNIVTLTPNPQTGNLNIDYDTDETTFSLSPINKKFQVVYSQQRGYWFRVGSVDPISGYQVVAQNSIIDQNVSYTTDDYVDGGGSNGNVLSSFSNNLTQFMAFKFVEGSNTFFGWMHITVSLDNINLGGSNLSIIINDAAYNSTPGGSILAGQGPPATTPGSTGSPFGITGGYVSSEILAKANASTFQFVDPQTTHMQEAAIYFTNSVADLSLGTLSASGPQVKVLLAPTNYRFIFSSYSDSTKNALGLNNKTAAFVLKVINGSGVVQNSISPALNLELYLDVSGGSIVNLDINGTAAGAGTYTRMEGSKFVYTTTFTNGSGAVGATVIPSNPSAGSDPHITTIFGKKYDFHPSTRRNYTLFKSKDMKVSSHFTGLKSGVYYDKVMIDLPNKQQVKVDFHSKQIKGKSSFVTLSKESLPIQYENHTSDKSVGKIFEPKKMTKLSVAGNNPVDLFIDFNTRYVHFRFPNTLPVPSEMSGLIVEPATRLD